MNQIGEKKIQGIVVYRKGETEDIDSMIKRFKKKVNKSNILRDLRRKSHFDKPSIAKRKKRNEAKKRLEKEQYKEFKQKNIKGDKRKNENNQGNK